MLDEKKVKNLDFFKKKTDKTRNCFIEEIKQNDLMSWKYKNLLLVLVSIVSSCVSVSIFDSLVGIPLGIVSSAVGLKICVITAGIEIYVSIIKKKKKDISWNSIVSKKIN